MDLEKLDKLVLYLQVHAIERSTHNNYATGARNYLRFCRIHNLPFDPTPQTPSRYIAYTSRFIASGPKYLTGARHFLKDFFPLGCLASLVVWSCVQLLYVVEYISIKILQYRQVLVTSSMPDLVFLKR